MQTTLVTARAPVLSADFRDRRHQGGRGAIYTEDWRKKPPPFQPGDENTAWEHPMELRLLFASLEHPLRQWMGNYKYTGGVLVYAGFENGDVLGIIVTPNTTSWTRSAADIPGHTLYRYTYPRGPDCLANESSPCVHAWRSGLYDVTPEDPTQGQRYDASKRPWFIGAVQAKKQAWQRPYFRIDMTMSLPACVPLYHHNGALQTVLCRDAPLELLEQFTKEHVGAISSQLKADALAFIVEADTGLLVGSSVEGLLVHDTAGHDSAGCTSNADPCRVYADRLRSSNGTKLTAAARRALQLMGGSWVAPLQSYSAIVDVDGERNFMHTQQLKDIYGLHWVLVSTVSRADLFDTFNQRLLQTIVICCLLVAVSMCIDCAVTTTITRPLQGLAQSMENVSSLSLVCVEAADMSCISELNKMQQSFNILVEQLRLYRGFLPQVLLVEPNDKADDSETHPASPSEQSETSGTEGVTLGAKTKDTVQETPKSTHVTAKVRARQTAELGRLRMRPATLLLSEYRLRREDAAADDTVPMATPDHERSGPFGLSPNDFVSVVLELAKSFEGLALQVTVNTRGVFVLLTWNTHMRHSEHSLQATGCAAGIVDNLVGNPQAAGRWWSCTASTGMFHVGNLGTDERRTPVVFGPALGEGFALSNLAPHLSARALITASTAERVRGYLPCRLADTVQLLEGGPVRNVYRLCTSADAMIDVVNDDTVTQGYMEAFSALRQGRPVDAVPLLASHVADHPDDCDAWRLLGIARRRQEEGNTDEYVRQQNAHWQAFGTPEPTLTVTPRSDEDSSSHSRSSCSSSPSATGQMRAQPAVDTAGTGAKRSWQRAPPDMMGGDIRLKIQEATSRKRDNTSGALPYEMTDQSGRTWHRSERRLGKGAFGEVHLGMGTTGEMIAIKSLPLPHGHDPDAAAKADAGANALAGFFAAGAEDSPQGDDDAAGGDCRKTVALTLGGISAIESLVNEVTLMSGLRNEHIVCFLGCCVDTSFVYLVMEYVAGGSLATMLEQFSHKLPPLSVRRYIRDMVAGLEFLHNSQVVHQDLKPANVLVTIDGMCKLADFGASAVLMHHAAGAAAGPVGTPHYMAPEAAAGKALAASDIWSLGITQLELITGALPWPPSDLRDPIAFTCALAEGDPPRPRIPERGRGCPDSAIAFAESCLKVASEDRRSAHQLSAHPFLIS